MRRYFPTILHETKNKYLHTRNIGRKKAALLSLDSDSNKYRANYQENFLLLFPSTASIISYKISMTNLKMKIERIREK